MASCLLRAARESLGLQSGPQTDLAGKLVLGPPATRTPCLELGSHTGPQRPPHPCPTQT